jgi:hypothetical protein
MTSRLVTGKTITFFYSVFAYYFVPQSTNGYIPTYCTLYFVGCGRAVPVRLMRLINTQNRALRAPRPSQLRCSSPDNEPTGNSLTLYNNCHLARWIIYIEKICEAAWGAEEGRVAQPKPTSILYTVYILGKGRGAQQSSKMRMNSFYYFVTKTLFGLHSKYSMLHIFCVWRGAYRS